VIQSLCTIASGGWFGNGLGQGFVKGYLPEARNDFIFAVICEELGMIGATAVIGLLIALMWQGRKTIIRCIDPAGKLMALGIVLTLGLQAAMNIGVVTVSIPTKGISLPLVSAGGSGAIFLGALTGILASIARTGPRTSGGFEEKRL
jgi:cell division protein FtsW